MNILTCRLSDTTRLASMLLAPRPGLASHPERHIFEFARKPAYPLRLQNESKRDDFTANAMTAKAHAGIEYGFERGAYKPAQEKYLDKPFMTIISHLYRIAQAIFSALATTETKIKRKHTHTATQTRTETTFRLISGPRHGRSACAMNVADLCGQLGPAGNGRTLGEHQLRHRSQDRPGNQSRPASRGNTQFPWRL